MMSLLWTPGPAGAQESPLPALAPDTPWFKVEVIVFQHRQAMAGDDEVFTPRLSHGIDEGAGEAGEPVTADGVPVFADAAALIPPESEPAGESVDTTPAGSDESGLALDADGPVAGDALAEAQRELTLEEKVFPAGSRFRLVERVELFPEPVVTGPASGLATGGESTDPSPGEPAFPETGPVTGAGVPAQDDGSYVPPEIPLSAEETALLSPLNTLELTAHATRIERRQAYRLLAHMAWIQPGYDSGQAVQFPLAELAGGRSGLVGGLTLIMSRYLHMQFDLGLDETLLAETESEQDGSTGLAGGLEALLSTPLGATEDESRPSSPVYHLGERRRMRSGELHYVDHPRFGVLLRVTPVDPAALALLQRQQAGEQSLLPRQP